MVLARACLETGDVVQARMVLQTGAVELESEGKVCVLSPRPAPEQLALDQGKHEGVGMR